MTRAEFLAFREAMARKLGLDEKILSERKLAVLMGTNRHMIHRWSATRDPPLYVDLACQALIENLAPWSASNEGKV